MLYFCFGFCQNVCVYWSSFFIIIFDLFNLLNCLSNAGNIMLYWHQNSAEQSSNFIFFIFVEGFLSGFFNLKNLILRKINKLKARVLVLQTNLRKSQMFFSYTCFYIECAMLASYFRWANLNMGYFATFFFLTLVSGETQFV